MYRPCWNASKQGLETYLTALTFRREFWQETMENGPQRIGMQAALLTDRGVVKVAGDDARRFLNGLVTVDMAKVTPANPRFAALLTAQGKIIVDFMIAEAPTEDGGGFFLDCPRALASTLVEKLNFYKLRAKVICEDLSEVLGVMAVWHGTSDSEYGLSYPDPRLSSLGWRIMLPPHLASQAAADLGATLVDAEAYETHRIVLGVPRGGLDFIYSDTFPHEADMDQLNGVDFDKGCYVGQEVVSRVVVSSRSLTMNSLQAPACRSRQMESRLGFSVQRPRVGALRYCVSIVSRTRLPAARRWKPEASPFAL